MKFYVSLIALILLSFCGTYAQSSFSDTVSVVTYNINNYGYASTTSCPLEGSPLKTGYIRTILKYLNAPDIVAFEKLSGSPKTLASDSMKRNIMDSVCPNCYGVVNYTKLSGYKKVNTLFYKTSKFGYLGTTSIYTADNSISDINMHRLYYKNPSLATTKDTIYLNVIVVHDASGASSASQRATELSGAMSWLSANVKTPGNYIFMGDFNTQSSSEACFQSLINPTDTVVRFFDPPNQLGNWSGTPIAFAKYLTQSTRSTDIGDCGSNNAMLARFDHILCANSIMQGTKNIQYIPGTFNVVGQDGLHTGKALIDAPTNVSVPSDVLNALYNLSEHLPVQLKLSISKQYPLPLGFEFLKVSILNDIPFVEWQNNNNSATLYYQIERSNDGNIYSGIKKIFVNTSSNNYNYQDNALGTEKVAYYRIKQVLKDGSSVYSKIVVLDNNSNRIKVTVSPNPVKDKLTAIFENLDVASATIYVLNSCGQVCINQKVQVHDGVNKLFENSIARLAKGIYVLKIQTNKELISKVFIKQ